MRQNASSTHCTSRKNTFIVRNKFPDHIIYYQSTVDLLIFCCTLYMSEGKLGFQSRADIQATQYLINIFLPCALNPKLVLESSPHFCVIAWWTVFKVRYQINLPANCAHSWESNINCLSNPHIWLHNNPGEPRT